MFVETLKDPSPERFIPDDYKPAKETWVSRAGGVYIATQGGGAGERSREAVREGGADPPAPTLREQATGRDASYLDEWARNGPA